MKINIKNLLFQPLALHLATDGEGLHLSSRECREILPEHVSVEIERAVARGFVSLVGGVAETERAQSYDKVAGMPECMAPVSEPPVGRKKGKAR